MIDTAYIEEIKALDNKEAKDKLDEYAQQFGIKLKKNKSFDNMLIDLQEELQKLSSEPLPESNSGISISDLIDSDDTQEDSDDTKSIDDELITDEKEINQSESSESSDEVDDINDDLDKYGDDVVKNDSFELPSDFSPKLTLMGRAPGYYTLPWWIYQWIKDTPDWKENPKAFKHPSAHDTLLSLIYYIKRDGSVVIRETRNSRFYTLE